jgi:GntR family transcriptional regulator, carbon starvation induced regulator
VRLEVGEVRHGGREHLEQRDALIAGCGMPRLLAACDVLDAHAERYRRLLLPWAGADGDPGPEHRAIAEAAVARNAAAACDRLAASFDRNRAALLARLAARTPDPNPKGPKR